MAVSGKQRQRIIPAGWKTTERADNKEEREKKDRQEDRQRETDTRKTG